MSNTTNLIFKGLQIVSWIIFIGLSIDAGAMIFNCVHLVLNVELLYGHYAEIEFYEAYEQGKWLFLGMYSFALSVAILKAFLFFIVVRLVQKIDLSRPFNQFVAHQISRISYYTLSIGLVSLIARQTAKNLGRYGYELNHFGEYWVDSQAFILMAAVIYLIAFIFKKGMEIQIENDLTV